MGRAKQHQLEVEGRGFTDIFDKFVCRDCVDDYALQNYIDMRADKNECSYCGKSSKNPIAVDLEDLMYLIVGGITYEWSTPLNEDFMYVSAEGGWQGKVIDKYELFSQIGFTVDNEQLLCDITDAIIEEEWCEKYYFTGNEKDFLINGWDVFRDTIKHQCRYVFLSRKETEDDSYRISTDKMLDALGKVFRKLSLEKTLMPGDKIIRVRVHDHLKKLTNPEELGAPPPNKAKSSRMSPVGISMLYAAFDQLTSIRETYNPSMTKNIITSATFEVLKEIKVLDLTKLPPIPSLFDEDERHKRDSIKFIKNLVENISKPISRDNQEHIDYYPTQVVSEYLRYIYKDESEENIKGIIYPSSVNEGGKSIVLFIGQEYLCDATSDFPCNNDKYLKLLNHLTTRIDPKTIKI